jgi:hypothetical protein
MPVKENVVMEDVRLIFRNFSGKEGQYNREGDRNFGVILPEEIGLQMLEDGWNIKRLKSRDDDELGPLKLDVTVSFKIRPPSVFMITSRGRTLLEEEDIDVLDWLEFTNVDLIVRPFAWAIGEKTGIKAYLKSLYATILEDPLELKYSELEMGARPLVNE